MVHLDNLLNRFPMYKIVLFSLSALFFISIMYSFTGNLFYKPLNLIASLAVLTIVCFFINHLIGKILKIPINLESSFITSFIMFFIMVPIARVSDLYIYVIAGIAATLSKYIFAINKKHIFNPAAFGLVIVGAAGLPGVNWWVGNSYLFPFVLVFGLIVVRKVRKLSMFAVYYIFSLLSISFFATQNNMEIGTTLVEAILSYPILFLGAFMLIEPLTTPPRRREQFIYGGIVGIFSGAQYHIGPIFSTPEIGLLIGNVYSFFVSLKERLILTLDYKKELAPQIFEFSFIKNTKINFLPGQYLEWSLGGVKYDLRGSRRFFSITSSPMEKDIKIAVKIIDNGSKFKAKLGSLKKGDKIYAEALAGDFLLNNSKNKYVFMAGGIGITPFRSIIKNAIDKNETLDAILFYSASTEKEFIYKDIFESAKLIGLITIYISSNASESFSGVKGRVDLNLLKKEVSDYKDREYLLSGPNSMVNSYKKMIRNLGVSPFKIKTDFFAGY